MQLDKRFSLDYLISGSNQPSQPVVERSQVAQDSMQEAINVYATPVLMRLKDSKNQAERLFPLLDSLQQSLPRTDIDTLRNVVKWMEKTGLVTTLESDPHGNDLIQKKV